MNVTRVPQDMNNQVMTSVVLSKLSPKLMITLILYKFATAKDLANIKNNPVVLELRLLCVTVDWMAFYAFVL